MNLDSVFLQFFDDDQLDYYPNYHKKLFGNDEFGKNFVQSEITIDNYYLPKTKLITNSKNNENDTGTDNRVDCNKIEELLDRLSLGHKNSTIESELKFLFDNIDDSFEPCTAVSAPTSVTSISHKNVNQDTFLGFTKVLTPTPVPLFKDYNLCVEAQQLLASIGNDKVSIVSSLGQSKVGKSFLSNILLSRPIRRSFPISNIKAADGVADNIQAYIFLAEYDSQSTVYGFIDWVGEVDSFQTRVSAFISDVVIFHYANENDDCLNKFLTSIVEMVSGGFISSDSSGIQNSQPMPLIKVIVHDSPKYTTTMGNFKHLEGYKIINLPFPIDETFDSPCIGNKTNKNNEIDPSLYPQHSYCVEFINACEELKQVLFIQALEKSKASLPKNGNILQHTLKCFKPGICGGDVNDCEQLKNVWNMARNAYDESLRFQCKEMFLKCIRQDLQSLLPIGTKHLLEKCYEFKIQVIDHHKKFVMGDEQQSLKELTQKLDKIVKKAIRENEEFAEKTNLNKLREIEKRFTNIDDIRDEYDKNIQGPTSVHYKTFREFERSFNDNG